jgi:4Fe-4S ferredoxin
VVEFARASSPLPPHVAHRLPRDLNRAMTVASMSNDTDLPAQADERSDFDPIRAKRAARDPKRPGEKCRAEPGVFAPRVNRARCEAKADCVAVCPYGVFEVGAIDEAEFRALPWLARFKVRAHGKKTAHTPRADACRACGLCVVACPEQAISLERVLRDA